ncbi:MAG TPA: FtsX-like permease family protein [Thermoanaerobaculia bacterium]
MRTQLLKVRRDLQAAAARNLMMTAAIAVGVVSVGTILGTYVVATREMARNYLGSRPAHATFEVERELSPAIVERVRRIDGVADAERHATLRGRMKIRADWLPALIFVIDDFEAMRTNRVTRESGAWPPPAGTMLIERTAQVTMEAEEGDSVVIKTPNGPPQPVVVSGIVHDPGLAPARQEQQGYAYVTRETLRRLGEPTGFDELRVRFDRDDLTAEEIEVRARGIASALRAHRYPVHQVQIPPPRRHPHQGQMQAILRLFLIFSYATLVLSAILVATSLATLMARQVREMGVMKAIGARSWQIGAMYIAGQAITAGAATLLAVPLSRHTAAVMTGKIAGLLNLEIVDPSVPLLVTAIQATSGLVIPMIVALVPVWRGSLVTVREALVSYGVSAGGRAPTSGAPRNMFGTTMALAVRNVFRQRSRLAMSLALLAAGGALFMTALDVSKAWEVNLEKIARFRHYDLEFRLARPIEAASAVRRAAAADGVRRVEAWQQYPASFTRDVPYDVASVYPDKGHGSFVILGVPPDTEMVTFPLLAGRWLDFSRPDEIVLNHTARAQARRVGVGDTVALNVEGRVTRWTVAGFVEDLGSTGATAYVADERLAAAAGRDATTTNMIRVALRDRDLAAVQASSTRVEGALGDDARVSIAFPMSLIRNAIAEHMSVLVSSLLALSLLMAIVGGFGLAATMSMTVMERVRELGVMRAIGASPGVIARLLVMEGFLIASMSLLFAIALAVALSSLLGVVIGTMAFQTPLPLVLSGTGIALWSLILLAGSAIATSAPAYRASRMTVRAALDYA